MTSGDINTLGFDDLTNLLFPPVPLLEARKDDIIQRLLQQNILRLDSDSDDKVLVFSKLERTISWSERHAKVLGVLWESLISSAFDLGLNRTSEASLIFNTFDVRDSWEHDRDEFVEPDACFVLPQRRLQSPSSPPNRLDVENDYINTSDPWLGGSIHVSNPTSVDRDYWCGLVVPVTCSIQGEGNRRIEAALTRILANDHCRAFTIGLQFNDDDLTLWYLDRSLIVTSALPLSQAVDPLITFLLRLMAASPEQLGFDPSVRRVQLYQATQGPSVRDCYEIDVHDSMDRTRTFRTLDFNILYDAGQREVLSRATRVWKVREVVDGEMCQSQYTLKDVWLAHQTTRWQYEGDVYRAVYKFVDTHPDYKDGRQNFLSLVADGLVVGGVDSAAMFDKIPEKRHTKGWRFHVLEFRRRSHYRIVFEELGTPLTELKSDDDAVTAISGAVQVLHALGLCHRDISPGNILLVKGPTNSVQRGILADFEFVIDLGDRNNTTGGTPLFMAVEVEEQQYKFERYTLRLPFRYTAMHDLEGIFWVLVWFLASRREISEPEEVRKSVAKLYDELFPRGDSYHLRLECLTDPAWWGDSSGILTTLQEERAVLFPKERGRYIAAIHAFQTIICRGYEDDEAEGDTIHKPDPSIHRDIQTLVLSALPRRSTLA